MKGIVCLISAMFVLGVLMPVAGAFASAAPASAVAVLDPQLKELMADAGPESTFEVIITYHVEMKETGMEKFDILGLAHKDLKILPMTGTILSVAQIGEVLGWSEVRSVYWNAPLSYNLKESADTAGARPVWDTYGEMGANATVMVIDSGVDGTHPDLLYGDRLLQSVLPIDILGAGLPVTWAENVPVTDSVGHGTHCLGIVGGGGLGLGGYTAGAAEDPLFHHVYRGMAPECKLVSFGLGAVLFVFGTVQGFEYALENHETLGIRVISNSWGPSAIQEFDENNPNNVATLECYKNGIMIVFAAGNDGPGEHTMGQYAVAPWVMGVAAGTKDKKLADFSSRGTNDPDMPYDHPDITAPGVEIMSARANSGWLSALSPISGPMNADTVPAHAFYIWMSGTSMACPHVSGIAGLLFSANPKLSPDQVMDIITYTADKMGELPVHKAGAGYINATAAYLLALETEGNIDAFLAGEMKYAKCDSDPDFARDCTSVGYDYWPVAEEPVAKAEETETKGTPGFGALAALGCISLLGIAVMSYKKKRL